MLKALVPLSAAGNAKFFSVYAKSRELSNTLSLFSPAKQGMRMQSACAAAPSPLELLENVQSCCSGQMRQKIQDVKKYAGHGADDADDE